MTLAILAALTIALAYRVNTKRYRKAIEAMKERARQNTARSKGDEMMKRGLFILF